MVKIEKAKVTRNCAAYILSLTNNSFTAIYETT